MGKKFKAINRGKMKVSSPKGFEVYEKKMPKKLKKSKDYCKYKWLGNFGFRKISNCKKVKGDFEKSYEIQVEDRYEKDLVYWNGKKTVRFKKTKGKGIGKVNYRVAKLKMGDPPIGWAL